MNRRHVSTAENEWPTALLVAASGRPGGSKGWLTADIGTLACPLFALHTPPWPYAIGNRPVAPARSVTTARAGRRG